MKVKKILACILAFAMILSTMSFTAFADADIIAMGAGTANETWSAAVAAAVDTDGDKAITYHVYGKVEVDKTGWVSPRGTSGATTINFVGMTDDAEICISNTAPTLIGFGNAPMVAMNYTNLILSRPNGSWANDMAHANQFFTTWMRGAVADAVVTYTNCTFLNGSCADTYNTTVYTDCTFKNPTNNALWIMGGKETTVTGGTFEAAKGLKTYNDNPATVINTTITDCTFDIEETPAIITSAIGDVTVTDVDASKCEYGVIENGVAGGALANVTIDGETPAYVATTTNKYGVPIYTTSVEYAEAVTEAAVENGKVSETVPVVAAIGNKFYTTLEEAIDAAEADAAVEANPVIKLLNDAVVIAGYYSNIGNSGALASLTIDLNGYTLYPKNDIKVYTDIKVMNGTIETANFGGTGAFYMFYDANGKTYDATFENVTIIEESNGSYAFVSPNAGDPDATFTFDNCTVELKNGESWVSFVNAQGGIKVIIDETTITSDNCGAVFVNVDAEITNSTISVTNAKANAFRNFSGTVVDSTIDVSGSENGIKTDNGKKLTVSGNSKVVMTGANGNDLILANGSSLEVVAPAEFIADKASIDDTSSTTGEVVTKADAIEVDFEPATSDETSLTYNIVLKGISAETINRLNSADLTFALNQTSGNNTYEIIDVANDNIAVNPVYNVADGSIIDGRYEFHFEHKTGVTNDTAAEIVIAQVKFTGYGKFDFVVATAATNEVHATKIRDNIVDTYIPNDDASTIIEGELVVDNFIDDAEIIVPKRDLTINVSFPNNIVARPYAYQAMKVTVAGPENYERVIYLGNGDAVNKEGDCENLKVAGDVVYYEETISGELTLNSPYTVTVEGAGYRTVKYTVNMTEDKTLNFWNNVKDNAKAVEVSESGVEKYAQTVTFLAGDIVKDNEINVYDLSAVVSYFGEIDLSETNKKDYAKYDLNRDGKIDSKDVAYVLVSWGN